MITVDGRFSLASAGGLSSSCSGVGAPEILLKTSAGIDTLKLIKELELTIIPCSGITDSLTVSSVMSLL